MTCASGSATIETYHVIFPDGRFAIHHFHQGPSLNTRFDVSVSNAFGRCARECLSVQFAPEEQKGNWSDGSSRNEMGEDAADLDAEQTKLDTSRNRRPNRDRVDSLSHNGGSCGHDDGPTWHSLSVRRSGACCMRDWPSRSSPWPARCRWRARRGLSVIMSWTKTRSTALRSFGFCMLAIWMRSGIASARLNLGNA